MKKFILVSTSVLSLTIVHGQTNVSGGIFSNTTWTKVNSPYIVVDTVVVFPNVTLTIQPGVTVKFDNNKRLEIRQAKLIAVGTATDSITFTSNSSTPTLNSWASIWINGGTLRSQFNYCNFKYGSMALRSNQNDTIFIKNSNFRYNNNAFYSWICNADSCVFTNNSAGLLNVYGIVKNSKFSKNTAGIYNLQTSPAMGYARILNCILDSNQTGIMNLCYTIIDSCNIIYNQYGISNDGWGAADGYSIIKNSNVSFNSETGINLTYIDTVINCQIKNNKIGVADSSINFNWTGQNIIEKNIIESNVIGVKLWNSNDQLNCNKICANSQYAFYYAVQFGSNIIVPNNNWCTPDSASTEVVIFDAHDNINYGIVFFMPLDTTCSPNTPTSINEIKIYSLSIFPNPFSTQTVLQTDNPFHNATLTIDNYFGQTVAQIKNINGQTIVFNRDNLASGLYFVRLTEENKIVAADKLIITDR